MKNRLSLQDWLYYISNLHFKFVDLSLGRIRDIAIELDLLHPAVNVILIGGTNGKGTTCSLLESIFLSNGMNVGVYTSPHLLFYTERLRINGIELAESDHIKAMSIVEKVRSNRPLTYFEFITLSNLYLLKNKNLDIALLEVGLGGRLDATNVVNPDISIVTNVAIDHTDLLGSNYMGIAKEKFGIFRPSKPAIVGDFKYPQILKNIICDWYGAIPFVKDKDWWFYVKEDKWCWWSDHYKLDLLPIPNIPVENAAVALSAMSFFEFSIFEKSIRGALNTVTLPGRFQIVSRNPMIILDVAHNPHASVYLSNRLKNMNILGVFRIVVGMLSNKNIFDTLHAFDSLSPIWYLCSLDCPLGASASQLAYCIGNYTFYRNFSNVCDAFYKALSEAHDEDCIVVFGSFYTVAPIFRLICKNTV